MRTVQETSERSALTRKAICEAAFTIIDSSGQEAIRMRALAAGLGVKAGSLYYHLKWTKEWGQAPTSDRCEQRLKKRRDRARLELAARLHE